MNRKLPYILLLTATVLWGGNFVIGRGFSTILPPFSLSLFRWIIAALIIAPFGWKEIKSNRELWKKEWKPVWWMALTGIAGFNTLLYIAVHYTTSINAALMNASTPVLIVILSVIFLKEKLTVRYVIGLVFSLIGVLFIISRGSLEALLAFSINKGELWMIAAIIVWSIYSVLVKKHAGNFPVYGLFMVTIIIGIIVLFPFAAYEWAVDMPMQWSWKAVLGLLYVGMFASVVAFLSWNHAVSAIGPGNAAPFLNLIPVFASIFAITFLGEKVIWSQIAGGAFTITGVLITTGILKRRSKSNVKLGVDKQMT